MSREITVSTAVFARIWAQRRPGEDSEDQILRRILGVFDDESTARPSSHDDGVAYPEFGVHFEEGTEIFRDYGRRGVPKVRYAAVATRGGFLLRNDGRFYPSLHKLSEAVVGGRENSWKNWKIKMGGQIVLIDTLRN